VSLVKVMNAPAKSTVIINAILFQITWFACALGSAKGLTWPAIASFAALAVYQLQERRRHSMDIKLLLLSIALGLIVDSFWVQTGMISFTENGPINQIAPLWIIMLWMAFALTINHSLYWLKKHPLLPALMGLFGGPMSYFAGIKFGALEYQANFLLVSLSLAITWAISLTILVRFAELKSASATAAA